MKKITTLIVIPVTLIILFSVFVNNKNENPTPQFSEQPRNGDLLLEEQKDERGEVGITVVPIIDSITGKIEFKVALNTHSVALDQDMTKASVLFDSAGNRYTPVAWEGAEPGGHHREGILKFSPVMSKSKGLTLKIKDVGGIKERIFQWSLNN